MPPRHLPCGCATCGCLCADHSPSRAESLCPLHAGTAVARWFAGDVAALASILLIACVTVWGAVLR